MSEIPERMAGAAVGIKEAFGEKSRPEEIVESDPERIIPEVNTNLNQTGATPSSIEAAQELAKTIKVAMSATMEHHQDMANRYINLWFQKFESRNLSKEETHFVLRSALTTLLDVIQVYEESEYNDGK